MTKMYVPDSRGMKELARSAEVGAATLAAAEKGAAAARAIAPHVSGEYAESIEAWPMTVQAGWNNEDRAGAAFGATVPYANAVEARHHTMSEAANRMRS